MSAVGQRGSPAAKIHEKAYGYGTPYDRLRAVDRHIDEVRRIRQAEQDGTMGAREARKARFQAALRKDKAYHPGYVEPLKAKGVTYMQTVLTHLQRVAQRGDGRGRVPQPRVPHGGRRDPHGVGGEI